MGVTVKALRRVRGAFFAGSLNVLVMGDFCDRAVVPGTGPDYTTSDKQSAIQGSY